MQDMKTFQGSKRLLKCAIISLLFFVCFPCFSEGWYICCGSYKNLGYAKEEARIIKHAGFCVFINTYNTENGKLYRILLRQNYETANQAAKEIRTIEKSEAGMQLKLKGLWPIKGNPRPIKNEEDAAQVQDLQDVTQNKPCPPEACSCCRCRMQALQDDAQNKPCPPETCNCCKCRMKDSVLESSKE